MLYKSNFGADIFDLLLGNGPLTVSQIRERLATDEVIATPQGIHYALGRLVFEGRVVRLGRFFAINLLWLESERKRLASAGEVHAKSAKIIKEGGRFQECAYSLGEMKKKWSAIVQSLLSLAQPDEYIEWVPTAWFPLFDVETEKLIADFHRQSGVPYHLMIGTRDKISERFAEFRSGVPGAVAFTESAPTRLLEMSFSVVGEYTVTIRQSRTLTEEISAFGDRWVGRSEELHHELASLIERRNQFEFTVTRDRTLAHRLSTYFFLSQRHAPHRSDFCNFCPSKFGAPLNASREAITTKIKSYLI